MKQLALFAPPKKRPRDSLALGHLWYGTKGFETAWWEYIGNGDWKKITTQKDCAPGARVELRPDCKANRP